MVCKFAINGSPQYKQDAARYNVGFDGRVALQDIANHRAYGKYMYVRAYKDAETVIYYVETTLGEYNVDCVVGQLFATFDCTLDASIECDIDEIGLCSDKDDLTNVAVCIAVGGIKKRVGESMSLQITTMLEHGVPLFVGGDNPLVRACLGVGSLDGEWGVVASRSAIPNIPTYRPPQTGVASASLTVNNDYESVSIGGLVDDNEVYESMLCIDNIPVLRDNSATYSPSLITVFARNGYGLVEGECDDVLSIQLDDGSYVLQFDKRWYGRTVGIDNLRLLNIRCDVDTTIITDPLAQYFALVSSSQIILCSIAISGYVHMHLSIPNDGYTIDIGTNGALFCYGNGVLGMYIEDNGVWTYRAVEIDNIDSVRVKTVSSDVYSIAMTTGRDMLNCAYYVASNTIELVDSVLDCSRVLDADETRFYVDNFEGSEYHLKIGDRDYIERAERIASAVANKTIFAQYEGLYLYDNGRQFNTLSDSTLRDTGYGSLGQKVVLCQTYLVVGLQDNSIDIVLFDRLSESLSVVARLDKQGSPLSSAAVVGGYVIIVLSSGDTICLAHDNSSMYFGYDDIVDGARQLLVVNYRVPNRTATAGGVAIKFGLGL